MCLFSSINSRCFTIVSLFEFSLIFVSIMIFSFERYWEAWSSLNLLILSEISSFILRASNLIYLSTSSSLMVELFSLTSFFSLTRILSLRVDWLISANVIFLICSIVNIRGSRNLLSSNWCLNVLFRLSHLPSFGTRPQSFSASDSGSVMAPSWKLKCSLSIRDYWAFLTCSSSTFFLSVSIA